MLDWSDPTVQIVVFLLVLWATTGLTFIHLGVLAARVVARPFRRRTKRAKQAARLAASGPVPTLTYIVPVFNDAMTVGPTIESILRQTVMPQRVIAVNDGSTDGTAEVLDQFRERGVHVIHLPQNRGKTRAIDAALSMVDTDLVAITDADSVVDKYYVEEMLKTFQADPELAAVGGAVESIPHTWVTASRQIEYMLTVHVDRDAETTMKSIIVLPGVSSTFRARVLRAMGFQFDTIAEDFDLTFRMQRQGRKIAMNLRAKVYTSDPPTLRAYFRQLVRWYTDFWLVIKKHRTIIGRRTFGAVEVPMLVVNATIASALYLVLPVWFVFSEPRELIMFFFVGFAMDLFLVVISWGTSGRRDVWWALVSRIPTRFLGRIAYLYAMIRVLVGRPGLAWTKLERRRTEDFLAASARGGTRLYRSKPAQD